MYIFSEVYPRNQEPGCVTSVTERILIDPERFTLKMAAVSEHLSDSDSESGTSSTSMVSEEVRVFEELEEEEVNDIMYVGPYNVRTRRR